MSESKVSDLQLDRVIGEVKDQIKSTEQSLSQLKRTLRNLMVQRLKRDKGIEIGGLVIDRKKSIFRVDEIKLSYGDLKILGSKQKKDGGFSKRSVELWRDPIEAYSVEKE